MAEKAEHNGTTATTTLELDRIFGQAHSVAVLCRRGVVSSCQAVAVLGLAVFDARYAICLIRETRFLTASLSSVQTEVAEDAEFETNFRDTALELGVQRL